MRPWNKNKTKKDFPQLGNAGIKKGSTIKNHGDKIGYGGFHIWLRRKFGDAIHCQNRARQIFSFPCNLKYNKFEWAKKKGRAHSRNKKCYYQLCVSCHRIYDHK